MIVPMKRLRIAGSKSVAGEVIDLLHESGTFHPANPSEDTVFEESGLETSGMLEEMALLLKTIEFLIKDVKSALLVLPDNDYCSLESKEFRDYGNFEMIQTIVDEILELSGEMGELQDELKEVEAYRSLFMEFLPLIEMVATSVDMELVGVSFTEEDGDPVAEVEETLEKVTGGACSIFRSAEDTDIALLVFPVSFQKEVAKEVLGERYSSVHLPERYEDKTFARTILRLKEKRAELTLRIKGLEEKLNQSSTLWRDWLRVALGKLERSLPPLRTKNYLASSERTFWISGFTPEDTSYSLKEELEKRLDVMVSVSEPFPHERNSTPVHLKNPFWATPFERLIHLYSLPLYGTIDPTLIVAITFPLFFGMILGDVGYAMVLAFAGYEIIRRWPSIPLARDFGGIMYMSALSAALFGLVYGEFFGKLWTRLGFYEPLFHRKEETATTLYMVLIVGVFHLALGLTLGAINCAKTGNRREMAEKLADLLFLLSIFAIGVVHFRGIDPGFWIVLPVIAVIVKLVAGDILITITELPKLFSNVLSYARLMALGLAAITLADLADDVFLATDILLLGIVGSVITHSASFLLGVVGPAIQAGRLHYVEFFSQFYIPQGIVYTPLK